MTKETEVLKFIHQAIHLSPELEAVRDSAIISEIDKKIDELYRE